MVVQAGPGPNLESLGFRLFSLSTVAHLVSAPLPLMDLLCESEDWNFGLGD